MFLNFEDTLEFTMTETDGIKQIPKIIIAQKYILKAGFKCFG